MILNRTDGTGWNRMEADGTGWRRMEPDGDGWNRMDSTPATKLTYNYAGLFEGDVISDKVEINADEVEVKVHVPPRLCR